MRLTKSFFVAALMGGASLFALNASAQDGDSPAAGSPAASGSLDEIIVTARGREESLFEVPLSETVFTSDVLTRANIDQVDDFLALTPGVTFANSQDAGTNFITIRGLSQTRNGEPPVAVVIDGVLQVNSRSFDQPLFDLESVEVLRGPQGALYGRNATGGAIIINTKMPTNEFEGYLEGTYGRGDEYAVEGSLSGPIVEDKLLFRVSARYLDREGYFDNPFLDQTVDYVEDIAVRGHLHFEPTDFLTIDLRGSLVRTEAGSLNFTYQPAVIDPATGVPSGFDFSINDSNRVDRTFIANNRGLDDRDIEQISLRAVANLGFAELQLTSAYDHITQSTGSDQFPYTQATSVILASPFALGDGTQSQFFDIEAFSQEVRLVSPDDQRFRWMIGGYYLATDRFISSSISSDLGLGQTRVESSPIFDPSNPLASFIADDNDNEAWALFFSTAYDVTEDLEFAFSGRYDSDDRTQNVHPSQGTYAAGVLTGPIGTPGAVNNADFSLFQPKVSLRYIVNDSLSVYGSWGRGFRSGQFNQNGVGVVAAGAGVTGVSDLLDQEETNTYEVGFKSRFLDRFTANGALYRTKIENAPYFVFIGAVSAQVLVPIDEVVILGGELELTANLMEGLDAYAAVAISDSDIKQYTVNAGAVGNAAPYVADYTFNAGLQYLTDVTDWLSVFGRIDYERRGRQYWDPENSTGRTPVDLVNLRAGFQDPDNGWAITASAENLFDEVYNSEFVTGGFAHAGVPRVWRVELRKNFN